jgi:glycosyltransferase involved in cell wall biosynthesis
MFDSTVASFGVGLDRDRLAEAHENASQGPLASLDPADVMVESEGARPLRILHCLWNGEVGGAQRAVHLLVREQLRDPALAPALLFAQGRGAYWEKAKQLGCPVITLDLPNGRAVRRVGVAATAMRPFDLHHFHSAELLLMLASARCRGVRRIYTHRGGSTRYSIGKRLRYGVAGLMLRRRFHGFSGNTAHAARFAAQLFRMDPEQFEVTYNGLEFDLLEPMRSADSVRQDLGLDASDFVLGTAAYLKAWKRIDRLLIAAARLEEPAMRVLIVGDGPDRQRLEALAADLGISENVIFAGKQLHVGDYLQVMDAFCLPSTSLESFGNAAVEAMAMGVPTMILADSGGMLEHIEDETTGLVAADQAELERSVQRLIQDRELAWRIGVAGRESMRLRYTPDQAALRYRRLYASALGA